MPLNGACDVEETRTVNTNHGVDRRSFCFDLFWQGAAQPAADTLNLAQRTLSARLSDESRTYVGVCVYVVLILDAPTCVKVKTGTKARNTYLTLFTFLLDTKPGDRTENFVLRGHKRFCLVSLDQRMMRWTWETETKNELLKQ